MTTIRLVLKTRIHGLIKSPNFKRRFHVIREIIGRGDISIQKIHTTENVADPFTKAMTQEQLDHHRQEMGIRYIVDWL